MTFSSLSIYVVFVDPHQGNKDVMPFSLHTTKAYVELIGGVKARHTCNAYIVKSNNGSKERWVIQSNKDVYVCGIYGGYI